jgi:hypothetical protein
VLLRLFAVLVMLGLLVGPAQAHDPSNVAGPPVPVLVDELVDTHDVDLVIVGEPPHQDSLKLPALTAPDAPPGRQAGVLVFRPPRAYAFN